MSKKSTDSFSTGSFIATPQNPETITVHEARVACDGSEGPLGHPRVYLTMNHDGFVECPYCDRRYILAKEAKRSHGH